jgi:predicted ATPase
LGTTLFNLGEFRSALAELGKAAALYELQKHRSHQLLYAVGIDPGVFMFCEFVRTLWPLGFPDQALARGVDAVNAARKLSHPPTLGHALVFAAIHHQFRREAEQALEWAEAAIALAKEHGLTQVWAWAIPFRGWAQAQLGRTTEGLRDIREGLAAHDSIGSKMSRPHYLALLAEALAKNGQVSEGLNALAEGLVASRHTRERYYEAELYRLQGELLLLIPDRMDTSGLSGTDGSQGSAEESFRKAIQTAHSQGAKSWELRALVSLGRLHLKRGAKKEARDLLADVCDWFNEGFDTLDMKEAKELLRQLS